MSYYHLYSATMNPCYLTKEAYAEAEETWLCNGCKYPKPNIDSIDVTIQSVPPDGDMNFIYGSGVPLAHLSIIEALGKHIVDRYLRLGKVFGPQGNMLPDWVTFRGCHRLIIRGSENISHRACETCGRHVYFATGKRYLCPSPMTGVELFESDLYGLVFTENLSAVMQKRWEKVALDRLAVSQVPEDSLPILFNNSDVAL